jgi:hypothetical protein
VFLKIPYAIDVQSGSVKINGRMTHPGGLPPCRDGRRCSTVPDSQQNVPFSDSSRPYSIRETVGVPPRYWDREFLISNIIEIE